MSPLSFIIPTEDKTDYNFKTAGRLASFELRFRENLTLNRKPNKTRVYTFIIGAELSKQGVLIYLIGLFCLVLLVYHILFPALHFVPNCLPGIQQRRSPDFRNKLNHIERKLYYTCCIIEQTCKHCY